MVPVHRQARHWRRYLTFGGLVLGLLLAKLWPRKTIIEQRAGALAENNKNLERKWPPGHKFKNYEHSSEDEHRTTEQFVWKEQQKLARYTFIAAVIAVGLSLATVMFTAYQAYIARQSFIATTRAWIDVTSDPTTMSLTWNGPNGPFITATITGENKGNSPALNATLFPVLLLGHTGLFVDIKASIQNACNLHGIIGNIIFVKESLTSHSTAELTWKTIDAYMQAINVMNRTPNEDLRYIPITFVMCATYVIVGDTTTHHTARVYSLGTPAVIGAANMGEDIPAGLVTLRRDPIGDYAD